MVTSITADSFSQQDASQKYDIDIQTAESLLDAVRKAAGKATNSQLINLLNEYIIKMTGHDEEGAEAIMGQISTLLKSFSNEISKANALGEKLESMAHPPTASGLVELQALIQALKQDVGTGDMTNLLGLTL